MTQDIRTSIEATRDYILNTLGAINNPGTQNLLQYLRESNYFTARCYGHHRFRGGLAHHSLGVAQKMTQATIDLPEQSRLIVGLLHDICKSRHPKYDHIARGHHGARSVALLEALGYRLTPEEYDGIKRHMHRTHARQTTPQDYHTLLMQNLVHYADHKDAAEVPYNAASPYPLAV